MTGAATAPAMSRSRRAPEDQGKQRRSSRTRDAAASVVVLPLSPTAQQRKILESRFRAGFCVYRATVRDARQRLVALEASEAFAAARAMPKGKVKNAALRAAQEAVGLTCFGLMDVAKDHRKASRWMADHGHLDTQVAGLLGRRVWEHAVSNRLFGRVKRDGTREATGLPKTPGWFDFTSLPGQAQQITPAGPEWGTIRLMGTLAGHRADPAAWPDRPVMRWGRHEGRFVLVWSTSIGNGHDLAVPVRLPGGPAAHARWDHYLSDRSKFVRVDLVRKRVKGHWDYSAHLVVLVPPWRGDRYAAVDLAAHEVGIDLGPSLAAFAARSVDTGSVETVYAAPTDQDRAKQSRLARGLRTHQRRLERQRRANNIDRFARRTRQAPQDTVPRGSRTEAHQSTQATDRVSNGMQRTRDAIKHASRTAAEERQRRANELAKQIVVRFGPRLVVEDCSLVSWQRRWVGSVLAFAPGMLLAALEREAVLAGGGLRRVSTRATRLSRTCACGAVDPKKLSQRHHACTVCGLGATHPVDRDLFSALLAACTTGHGSAAVPDLGLASASIEQLKTEGRLSVLAGPSPARRPKGRRSRAAGKPVPPWHRQANRRLRASGTPPDQAEHS